jgi:autotransporter-associated beta strand protein
MNPSILVAIRCSLLFFLPAGAHAISAQWDLDPISGDWNTAANWTPDEVPNGPADTATFGLSHTTDVSISANTEVNGITFTAAATNPYTITASAGLKLTISGVGITNNSGRTQHFVTLDDASGNVGTIVFSHHATAGSNVSISNDGGSTNFFNRSTAGNARLFNGFDGSINFFNNSTAGSASIGLFSEGSTNFFNSSTAGNSLIDCSNVLFADNSTAGTADILIHDNSILRFLGHSSAGSANLGSAGQIEFHDSSAAGSAFVSGGFISFFGSSRGDTAQIDLLFEPDFFIFGELDISGHNATGVTIGSLAGNEGTFVFLGANNLTIGSNNLSTTFSGEIAGTGGSLTKIGSGTLILSGANTYTGNTNVNGGVLQVDGSITSNTLVNHSGTLAGAGTINGNVVNNARVSPGALGVPGELTVVHDYTQAQFATLMIQIAGVSPDQFSVLNVLGNASLNGFLDPVLLNGFVPSIGDSFVFLNYASLSGEFSQIRHPIFDNGMLQWSVIYEANNAILTVEQNVPDQGSTFLLLTLGLLGLVTYRRQLLRGRP